jgi:RecJ-like exonuclease
MCEEVTIEKSCLYCNGWGYVNSTDGKTAMISLEDYMRGRYKVVVCPRCLGKKKLDWIEEITGVRRFRKNANT